MYIYENTIQLTINDEVRILNMIEPVKKVDVGNGNIFEVPERFQFLRKLGSGAYGLFSNPIYLFSRYCRCFQR